MKHVCINIPHLNLLYWLWTYCIDWNVTDDISHMQYSITGMSEVIINKIKSMTVYCRIALKMHMEFFLSIFQSNIH